MATLALSLGGAALGGFATGGAQLGISLGFSAGSLLGNALFTGGDRTTVGPRLDDVKVTSSAYGSVIPLVWGRMRLGGNVIWSPGLSEHRNEETQSAGGGGLLGKGGGPSVTSVSFSYTASFAVALAAGPISGISRVWADGKLIADFTGSGAPLGSAALGAGGLRTYLGSETQLPDVAIQADVGIADAPAYRGLAYLMFEDLPLADFGNRIPQITAEIGTATSTPNFLTVTVAGPSSPVVSEGAIWSSDGRFLTSIAGQAMSVIDAVNARLVMDGPSRLPVTPGSSHFHSVGADGAIYIANGIGFGASGTFYKLDPNGLVITAKTAAGGTSSDVTNLGLIGSSIGEIAIGLVFTSGRLLWFSTTPEGATADGFPMLVQLQNRDVRTEFAIDPYDIAVEPSGAGWVVGHRSGVSKLLRIIGEDVNEVFDLGLAGDTEWVGYDASTRSLIIGELTGGGDQILHRWSIDSQSIVASFTTPLSFSLERGMFRQGAVDGRIWFELAGFGVEIVEIETAGMTEVRRLNIGSDWTPSGATPTGLLYDRITRSLVMVSSGNVDFYRLDRVSFAGGAGDVALSTIVADLSARVGLAAGDIDVSALTASVQGFIVKDQGPARRALESLQAAYFFDAVESDFTVKFLPRGGASVATIPAADLRASDSADDEAPEITVVRAQEIELPERVDVRFLDPALDFQDDDQHAKRIAEAITTKRSITLNLPLALDAGEAKRIAERTLFLAWVDRTRLRLALGPRWTALDPGDVVTIQATSATFTALIGKVDLGADGRVAIEATADDAAVLVSTAAANAPLGVPAQIVELAGPSAFFVMDTPLLRDLDDGRFPYVAAGAFGPETWPGAAIFKSADGIDFANPVTFVPAAANVVHGVAETALADGPTTVFDRQNTLTVSLFRGSLASVTELDVLNGANAALLGDEVIQFAGATLQADGSYVLDTLLRGRRGTEWAAAGHVAGERFIVLSPATAFALQTATAEIGLTRFYKAVTVGGRPLDGRIETVTLAGRAFMPLSPVHIAGSLAANDWTITWIRRTRVGGEWRDFVDVPLGETSEAYEVDILDGTGALKRTITATASAGGSVVTPVSQSALYTSADQIADFGANQTTLSVKVYQLSATVGRGFPGAGSLAA